MFIPLCQAVQHAHQKAILHRDLKPSNILAMKVDGRPVPKVIDFCFGCRCSASSGSNQARLKLFSLFSCFGILRH
jgi:serine/threonine protein kinase